MLATLTRVVLLLGLFTCFCARGSDHSPSVLFISSYHPGFPTFFQQIDGLRSVFNTNNVRLDIEFLDSKRFVDYEEHFQRTLEDKLRILPPYDLIITGDDAATFFASQRRNTLFADTPIIFFGVNDREFGLEFNQVPQITGVLEATSNKETIQLMRSLFGAHSPMSIITDGTPTGRIDTQRFEEDLRQLNFTNYHVLSLEDLSYSELMHEVSLLPHVGTIIIMACYRDRTGTIRDFNSTISELREHTHLPIFHLWRHAIGNGILGGKIVSLYDQARLAAELGQAVLNGKPIAEIPVVSESPNHYLFDYRIMQEFNLGTGDMPIGSQFINLPDDENSTLIQVLYLGGGFITLLGLAVVGLLLKIRIRQRRETKILQANRELEHAVAARTEDLAQLNVETHQLLRLRNSILDNTVACIVLVQDDVIQWVNNHTEDLFGYQPDELIGKPIASLLYQTSDYSRVAFESPRVLERGETYQGEFNCKRKDGSTLWVMYSGKALNPDNLSDGVLYVLVDFTTRKDMEDQLKDMNQTLEKLVATDHLTGIYNRRYINDQIQAELQRTDRYQIPFSIILVDVDHFKRINDQFGHISGDNALIQVANTLRSSCREVDTVARWGGEEFLILCPQTNHEQALQVAETLRQRLIKNGQLLPIRITASFGVASYHSGQSLEELLKEADSALYRAKETRNCVQGSMKSA